jgi:hypothetical protein
MRVKVGFISPQRADLDDLKKSFPETIFNHGKNVMEFFQTAGSGGYHALIIKDSQIAKDLYAIHHFLRSKTIFQRTPLLFLAEDSFLCQGPIADPLARLFFNSSGTTSLITNDFLEFAQGRASIMKAAPNLESIAQLAASQISLHLPGHPEFEVCISSFEEMHSEFQIQAMTEISTSLLWVRLNARVQIEGGDSFDKVSDTLKKFLEPGITDDELESAFEAHLNAGLASALKTVNAELAQSGALPFLHSDEIPMAMKVPFIKAAKSQAHTFLVPGLRIILELTRYI